VRPAHTAEYAASGDCADLNVVLMSICPQRLAPDPRSGCWRLFRRRGTWRRRGERPWAGCTWQRWS